MKLAHILTWTSVWAKLTSASLRGWHEESDSLNNNTKNLDSHNNLTLNLTHTMDEDSFQLLATEEQEEVNDHQSFMTNKGNMTTKGDRSLLFQKPPKLVVVSDRAVPLERPSSTFSSTTDDYYGWSVVMQGNIAAVGAPFDDTNGEAAGAVHVYEKKRNKNMWSYKTKLMPTQANRLDNFGNHLEFIGNDENGNLILAVGAPARTTQRKGRVFFFVRNNNTGNWSQSNYLLRGIEANDGFGHHFSYCPVTDRLAVGAYSFGSVRQGAVLVYTKRKKKFGWNEQARFSSGSYLGSIFESFGFYVFLIENVMVISAPGRDDSPGAEWLFKGVAPSGKVYVFTENKNSRGTWTRQQRIKLPHFLTTPVNIFGRGMYFDGEYITIGSPFHMVPFGSAFVYKKNKHGTFDKVQTLPPPGPGILAMGKYVYRMDNRLFIQGSIIPDQIRLPPDFVTGQAGVNVYELSNEEDEWVYQYTLTQDFNPIFREWTGGSFGISIHGDGNLLIVGDKRIDEAYIVDLNSIEVR